VSASVACFGGGHEAFDDAEVCDRVIRWDRQWRAVQHGGGEGIGLDAVRIGRIERLMASAGYFGKLPALVFATVQLLLPVAVFALIMAYWRTGPSLLFAA